MSAALAIAWAIWMWAAIALVFRFVGAAGLVSMFPEGRRWWLLPAQWLTLAHFAVAVLFHPF